MTNKLPEVGKRYKNKLTGREYFLATIDAIFTRFSDEFIALEFFFRIPFQEVLARNLDGNNQFRISVVYDKEKLERFFDDFEELPEKQEEPNLCDKCGYDYINDKEIGRGHICAPKTQEKDEVQEAKEELKRSIHNSWNIITIGTEQLSNILMDIRQKAQNLIDALDKQNLRDKENSLSGGEAKCIYQNEDCPICPKEEARLVSKATGYFTGLPEAPVPLEQKPQSIWRSVEELPWIDNDFYRGPGDYFVKNIDGRIRFENRINIFGAMEEGKYLFLADFINDYEALKAKVEKLVNPWIGNLKISPNSPDSKGYCNLGSEEIIINKSEEKK